MEAAIFGEYLCCVTIEHMERPEDQSLEAEYSRAAATLAERFIQRQDIYGRQLDDGRYICVHEPLSEKLLVAHLRGELTLGAYVLGEDSQASFIVFDNDTCGFTYGFYKP